jgi:fumarate hydratase subunit alpha
MKEISASTITETVARLCQEADFYLPQDVVDALKRARKTEESPLGQQTIDRLLENTELASKEQMAICQDCGVAVVYMELGQDVHITGKYLYDAIDEGVRQGYEKGYLRKSMVKQPFSARINTKDNTPAVVHVEIVPGDKLKLYVLPKGGGSENCSRLTVLTPAKGRQGIIDFVVNLVNDSGSNPCPPIIIGLGIGGTTDKTMTLAKKALLRKVGEPNPDAEVAELERDILKQVNNLGIGPMGYGGRNTALAVHAETFPAHIASMPVAVNIQCWCARHKEAIL